MPESTQRPEIVDRVDSESKNPDDDDNEPRLFAAKEHPEVIGIVDSNLENRYVWDDEDVDEDDSVYNDVYDEDDYNEYIYFVEQARQKKPGHVSGTNSNDCQVMKEATRMVSNVFEEGWLDQNDLKVELSMLFDVVDTLFRSGSGDDDGRLRSKRHAELVSKFDDISEFRTLWKELQSDSIANNRGNISEFRSLQKELQSESITNNRSNDRSRKGKAITNQKKKINEKEFDAWTAQYGPKEDNTLGADFWIKVNETDLTIKSQLAKAEAGVGGWKLVHDLSGNDHPVFHLLAFGGLKNRSKKRKFGLRKRNVCAYDKNKQLWMLIAISERK